MRSFRGGAAPTERKAFSFTLLETLAIAGVFERLDNLTPCSAERRSLND
jgi:hypothetical protein